MVFSFLQKYFAVLRIWLDLSNLKSCGLPLKIPSKYVSIVKGASQQDTFSVCCLLFSSL